MRSGIYEILLMPVFFLLIFLPTIIAFVLCKKNKLTKDMRNVTIALNVMAIIFLFAKTLQLLSIVAWIGSFFTLKPDKKQIKRVKNKKVFLGNGAPTHRNRIR